MPLFVLEQGHADGVSRFAIDHDVREVFEPNPAKGLALEVEGELARSGLNRC